MWVKYLFSLFCVLSSVALFGAGCDNKGAEKPKVPRRSSSDVADKTTLLATIAADETPQSIVPPSGLGIHPSFANSFQFTFSERGGGVAYVVEKDGKSHVVHNGENLGTLVHRVLSA